MVHLRAPRNSCAAFAFIAFNHHRDMDFVYEDNSWLAMGITMVAWPLIEDNNKHSTTDNIYIRFGSKDMLILHKHIPYTEVHCCSTKATCTAPCL